MRVGKFLKNSIDWNENGGNFYKGCMSSLTSSLIPRYRGRRDHIECLRHTLSETSIRGKLRSMNTR